jgi:threonine dehydratase
MRETRATPAAIDRDGIAATCEVIRPALRVGELMFPIARARLDRVVLVADEAIRRAQQALWDGARIVAESGDAAAFAALLAGAYRPAAGERVGVVISGANTTAVDFALQAGAPT